MSKFNWWRRERKKPILQKKNALKGKSFLLQQIENGDYDFSDYLRQAKEELRMAREEQAKIVKSWKAGPESLKQKLYEVELRYIKRYNKLMEDYHEEENRLLSKLRTELIKEFGVNCWEEALQANPEQDLISFYKNYKVIAQKKILK